MKKSILIGMVLLLIGSFAFAQPCKAADNWPKGKKITCIVPWKAGGSADTMARQLIKYWEPLLGANIIVNDIDPKRAHADKRTVVDFETLMRKADIVSLHLPLTELSENLINAKSLSWCKKGVIIVNTARGGIFDTNAVVEAAKSGHIGAVATDAFTSEPPDFASELFAVDNIMTTPHISAMTLEAQVAVAVNAATELRRVLLEGLPPTNNIFDEE